MQEFDALLASRRGQGQGAGGGKSAGSSGQAGGRKVGKGGCGAIGVMEG